MSSNNPFVEAYYNGLNAITIKTQNEFQEIIQTLNDRLKCNYNIDKIIVYRSISSDLKKYLESNNITIKPASNLVMCKEGPTYTLNFSKYNKLPELREKYLLLYEQKIEKQIQNVLETCKKPYNQGKKKFTYYGSLLRKTEHRLVNEYGLTFDYVAGTQREPTPAYYFTINI